VSLPVAHSLSSELQQDYLALQRTDGGAVQGDLGAGRVTQAHVRLLPEIEFVNSTCGEHGLNGLAAVRDNRDPARIDRVDPCMVNPHRLRGGLIL
jgi:hypothetical protein